MPQLQKVQNKHISLFSRVSLDSLYPTSLETTGRQATETRYQTESLFGIKM